MEACGDGFWEFDLIGGSAWFSDWFYEKLAWPTRHQAFDVVRLAADAATRRLGRAHGEATRTSRARAPAGRRDRSRAGRARASNGGAFAARRSATAQANRSILRAACAKYSKLRRKADAAHAHCLASAFDALPVAAALLDSHATVIVANQQWRDIPEAHSTQAIARLRAANSQTAIEFWLDEGEHPRACGRPLRVRAIAFQHEGSRHLAVTLEDRRSD